MAILDTLRYTKIPLTHGSGEIPALGFGTLIPDPLATRQATKTALEVGFRHFDCAERHRNEQAVGDAMQGMFKAGKIQRKDVFVTTKLWNNSPGCHGCADPDGPRYRSRHRRCPGVAARLGLA